MLTIPNVVSLIDKWPSLSDFARDAGVTYGAAKQMRRRRSIPVAYWSGLIDSQTGQALLVTADLLARAHVPAQSEAEPEVEHEQRAVA